MHQADDLRMLLCQVLEAALPESADDLMGLIMRHTAAGPPARFAAAQLLTIAAKCMVSSHTYRIVVLATAGSA